MFYLISFAARPPEYLYKLLGNATREVLLDSGAFSVNNKNIPKHLSLNGYEKFLSKLKKRPNIKTINYDCLGDGKKSLENYKRLKQYGVLPVYQFGADLKDLDYYLEQSEFVCVGGLVRRTLSERVSLFKIIEKRYSRDIFRRMHLLGVGGHVDKIINRFRPYSTDSSILNMTSCYQKTALTFQNGKLFRFKIDEKTHKAIQPKALNYKHTDRLHIYKSYWDQKVVTATLFTLGEIEKYQSYFSNEKPPTKIYLVVGTNKMLDNLFYT